MDSRSTHANLIILRAKSGLNQPINILRYLSFSKQSISLQCFECHGTFCLKLASFIFFCSKIILILKFTQLQQEEKNFMFNGMHFRSESAKYKLFLDWIFSWQIENSPTIKKENVISSWMAAIMMTYWPFVSVILRIPSLHSQIIIHSLTYFNSQYVPRKFRCIFFSMSDSNISLYANSIFLSKSVLIT